MCHVTRRLTLISDDHYDANNYDDDGMTIATIRLL